MANFNFILEISNLNYPDIYVQVASNSHLGGLRGHDGLQMTSKVTSETIPLVVRDKSSGAMTGSDVREILKSRHDQGARGHLDRGAIVDLQDRGTHYFRHVLSR